jgi:HSP20 family protein
MFQRSSPPAGPGRDWRPALRGSARGSSLSPFGDGGPHALLRQLDEDMSRLFDEFFGTPTGAPGGSAGWMPPVEVHERDGRLHVCTDLPGLSKEDIKVDIGDGQLTIQGERRRQGGDDTAGGNAGTADASRRSGGYFRSERSYGSFYRSIALPEGVDADSAQASFRDGVLDVSFDVPRAEAARSRRLEISDAATSSPG